MTEATGSFGDALAPPQMRRGSPGVLPVPKPLGSAAGPGLFEEDEHNSAYSCRGSCDHRKPGCITRKIGFKAPRDRVALYAEDFGEHVARGDVGICKWSWLPRRFREGFFA